MSHMPTDVLNLQNCIFALAINDVTTNCGTMAADEVEAAVIISYIKFIGLLNADYGHIPRPASITDAMLRSKVKMLFSIYSL